MNTFELAHPTIPLDSLTLKFTYLEKREFFNVGADRR